MCVELIVWGWRIKQLTLRSSGVGESLSAALSACLERQRSRAANTHTAE